MKKLFALPLAALAVGLVACSDAQETLSPQFELQNEAERIAAANVNAHVYGSFALPFTETVGTPGGWGVITSGPANFPGNAKNAGTCDNGLWINSQNKRTSGSMDKPHPHCVGQTEGSEEEVPVLVVLEPISARYTTYGQGGQQIQFNVTETDGRVRLTGNGESSTGQGIIVGYAIDASTLGTTNRRVGILTFALNQFTDSDRSYFDEDCAIDDVEDAPRCLDKVITATYTPLSEGGVGEVTEDVTGFLYWTLANTPFNYGGN